MQLYSSKVFIGKAILLEHIDLAKDSYSVTPKNLNVAAILCSQFLIFVNKPAETFSVVRRPNNANNRKNEVMRNQVNIKMPIVSKHVTNLNMIAF